MNNSETNSTDNKKFYLIRGGGRVSTGGMFPAIRRAYDNIKNSRRVEVLRMPGVFSSADGPANLVLAYKETGNIQFVKTDGELTEVQIQNLKDTKIPCGILSSSSSTWTCNRINRSRTETGNKTQVKTRGRTFVGAGSSNS